MPDNSESIQLPAMDDPDYGIGCEFIASWVQDSMIYRATFIREIGGWRLVSTSNFPVDEEQELFDYLSRRFGLT